jgi:hypothetical protein
MHHEKRKFRESKKFAEETKSKEEEAVMILFETPREKHSETSKKNSACILLPATGKKIVLRKISKISEVKNTEIRRKSHWKSRFPNSSTIRAGSEFASGDSNDDEDSVDGWRF